MSFVRRYLILLLLMTVSAQAGIVYMIDAGLGMSFLGKREADYLERWQLQRIDNRHGGTFSFSGSFLLWPRFDIGFGFESRYKGTEFSITNAMKIQKRETIRHIPFYATTTYYLRNFIGGGQGRVNIGLSFFTGFMFVKKRTVLLDYNYGEVSQAIYLKTPPARQRDKHLIFGPAVSFIYRTGGSAVTYLRYRHNFIPGIPRFYPDISLGLIAHIAFYREKEDDDKKKKDKKAVETPADVGTEAAEASGVAEVTETNDPQTPGEKVKDIREKIKSAREETDAADTKGEVDEKD